MVDVEKLLKKRNVLMNTIKYAVEQNEEKLTRKTDTDIIEIASSVQIIKSKLKSIVEFNEAVMDELSEVQATVEGEKFYFFELAIHKHLTIISAVSKTTRSDEATTERSTNQHIRLPKIELKKFNGDPLAWRTFIDSFECAINQQKRLSGVEKMTSLLGLVEGEAE